MWISEIGTSHTLRTCDPLSVRVSSCPPIFVLYINGRVDKGNWHNRYAQDILSSARSNRVTATNFLASLMIMAACFFGKEDDRVRFSEEAPFAVVARQLRHFIRNEVYEGELPFNGSSFKEI